MTKLEKELMDVILSEPRGSDAYTFAVEKTIELNKIDLKAAEEADNDESKTRELDLKEVSLKHEKELKEKELEISLKKAELEHDSKIKELEFKANEEAAAAVESRKQTFWTKVLSVITAVLGFIGTVLAVAIPAILGMADHREERRSKKEMLETAYNKEAGGDIITMQAGKEAFKSALK